MSAAYYCTKCGSQNHLADVCSKPQQANVQPPPDLNAEAYAKAERERAAREAAEAAKPKPPPLDPPRWPGGPQICVKENLPSFPDSAALSRFATTDTPSCKEVKRWQCTHCGGWHRTALAPSPSGTTSGTSRESMLPKNFVPFVRKGTYKAKPDQEELPKREVKAQKSLEPKLPKSPNKDAGQTRFL